MAVTNAGLCCEPCMLVKVQYTQAELLCRHCLERYCEGCALDHTKYRVFRDHDISKLTPAVKCTSIDAGYLTLVSSKDFSGQQDTLRPKVTAKANGETHAGEHVKTSIWESASFRVRLAESSLAKRIRDTAVNRVLAGLLDLAVDRFGICLFAETVKVFQCDFTIIRKYTLHKGMLVVEVGRNSVLGEGRLRILSDKADEIDATLKRIGKALSGITNDI